MKKYLPHAALFLIYIFVLLIQIRYIANGAAALWHALTDEPYFCVSFAEGLIPYLIDAMLLFSVSIFLVILTSYAAIWSGICKPEQFQQLYLWLKKLRYVFISFAILAGASIVICYVQYEKPEQTDAWVEKTLSPPDAEGVNEHYFTETHGELTQYYYVDKQHLHHSMLKDKAWHVYALRANMYVHAAQPYGEYGWLRGGIVSAYIFFWCALLGFLGYIPARKRK